ncbi:hypothetical protein J2X81_003978, partial [Sinomonas atrocyanea]|nr:hypothetical protein [Sinomonas atrocyanea]
MDDWGQNVMPEPDRPTLLILPDQRATKKVTG